ncbi:MAG: transcriptional repressor [Spirochaetaceae bacterium]|jgi:Fur family ferric uptake transcriptional regulator|nr:transcriptional repressor [Spirochaetaceae bacterium]
MKTRRPASYSTRQQKLILDYLASLGDSHVTVFQLVRHFEQEAAGIGQTTIYRHLEKLAARGIIRKYVLNDGKSACYQYVGNDVCREHFHLTCEQCGSLIHLDCELLDTIQGHLLREHGFQINKLKTVFYGTCGKCLSPYTR